MAASGGTSGRGGHGATHGLQRPAGGSNIEPWRPTARHCWVRLTGERQPGLLLDWRRSAGGEWQGLVVRQIPGGHAATWVAASVLEPVADGSGM